MTHASSSMALAPAQLALAISNPGALGSIEAYIGAVNRLPMLTGDQETSLGHRLRDENDLDAARELILSHLRLVVSIARQYLGYGLPHADLIQEGNIGLMKAVRRFDPDRGVRLVSFAVYWIRAEIHEYVIRNWRLVKIATTKAQRKLFFNLRRMRPDGGSLGTAQTADIAQELNVRPEDVAEMEVRMSGGEYALDAPADDEDRFAPASWIADPSHEPAQVLARRGMDALQGERLEQALQSLDARSQRIMRARWLADEGSTLHELAAEYGISAERVRQIEAAALKKLRTALDGQAPDFQTA
ncbi:RNA polymerase sigma factor RpoH [Castellaniella sp. UC4442_H9]